MDELGSRGFCLICQRGVDDKQAKIVDEKTGKCMDSCSGIGKIITKKKTSWFKEATDYEYEVCTRCYSTRCKRCSTAKPDGCVECRDNLFPERQENGSLDCVKFNEHKIFFYVIYGSLGLISAIILAVLVNRLIMTSKKADKNKKKKTKTRTVLRQRSPKKPIALDDLPLVSNNEHISRHDTPFPRMSALKVPTKKSDKKSQNFNTDLEDEKEKEDEIFLSAGIGEENMGITESENLLEKGSKTDEVTLKLLRRIRDLEKARFEDLRSRERSRLQDRRRFEDLEAEVALLRDGDGGRVQSNSEYK